MYQLLRICAQERHTVPNITARWGTLRMASLCSRSGYLPATHQATAAPQSWPTRRTFSWPVASISPSTSLASSSMS